MTSNSQLVVLRERAILELPALLNERSPRGIFLVADQAAITASGADAILENAFRDWATTRFTDFAPNPTVEEIERGVDRFRSSQHDLVIAVGGGTAIDLAKLIGALGHEPHSPRAVITGGLELSRTGPSLVAIPTTAGTGSEATQFAVAYVDQRKYSVSDPRLLPRYALIDPTLVRSAPLQTRIACGLDAFCQAVESIWAVAGTDASVGIACESVQLTLGHLESAVASPNSENLTAMCRASHLAGQAINISKTTAAHALSYAMTIHFGVPHGIAVALTLSNLLRFNAAVGESDCMDPRGPEDVRRRIAMLSELLGAASAEAAAKAIDSFVQKLGAPQRLRDVGIEGDKTIRFLAEAVNAERLANNPRRSSKKTIHEILLSIR